MRRAVIVAAAVSLGFAAAAPARPSACQRLQAHHKDRSPNRRLVLVYRGNNASGSISACVLPRGKVHRLASWDDDLERDSYSIAATKGLFVLIGYGHSDQYGGRASSLARYDGRTGNEVTLAGYGCQIEGYMQTSCPDGTSYGKYVLAASGAGALERTDLATQITTLQSFGPAGALAKLDDGPVDSLALDGTEIVWTRAGAEHRAPLPTRNAA